MKFLDTSFLIDVIRKKTSSEELLKELDKYSPHVTNTIVVHVFLIGAYGVKNYEEELKVKMNL